MPLRIFNNLNSQFAQNRLDKNNLSLGKVISKVASGERVQKSTDDGANFAISESLRSDARTFQQGLSNLENGLAMIVSETKCEKKAVVSIDQNSNMQQK